MIKLTIDSYQIEVPEGTTVLEAAKKLGIEIPTLCYHEALEPYGACRVCIVELISGKWSRLMAACTYPVWEGLEVKTNSKKATEARRFVIELLLARSTNSERIWELAKQMGVEKSRFKTADEREMCILCGLCVRVCGEMIKRSAISFINRGIERAVETPFKIDSEVCIGCGACAFVCPTGAIKLEDIKGYRKLDTWHTQHELARCRVCGNWFAPLVQIKYLQDKIELPKEVFELCSVCKRKRLGEELVKIEAGHIKKD